MFIYFTKTGFLFILLMSALVALRATQSLSTSLALKTKDTYGSFDWLPPLSTITSRSTCTDHVTLEDKKTPTPLLDATFLKRSRWLYVF